MRWTKKVSIHSTRNEHERASCLDSYTCRFHSLVHWVGKPKTSNIRKIDCCFVRIEPADILSQLLAEKQLSRSLTKIRNSRVLYRLNWIPLAASCSCTENDRWSTVPAFLWKKCVDPKFWTVYPCLTEGLFIHSTFWEREKKCCLDLNILENYIAICGLFTI